MVRVAVGGLGGGGDVGLALALLEASSLGIKDGVVASFLKCNVSSDRLDDLVLRGSLIRIPKGYFSSPRVFEDKIPLVEPRLDGRVYGICVKHNWRLLTEGLIRLVDMHGIRFMLASDIGGDALVLGYERVLGSYKTDTVARAAMAFLSREVGLKALVAAGAVGAEGGGAELDEEWLAATLLYLDSLGAIKGSITLGAGHIGIAETLLRLGESGMLSMLVRAAQGARKARICSAYLCGEYEIKPWYNTTYLIDPETLCEASPLCKTVYGRGWPGISSWEKRKLKPPREILGILKEVKHAGAHQILTSIAEKRISPKLLRKWFLNK